jgi:hypothetical protein
VFYAVNGNQKAVLLHAVVKAKERLLQKDIEAAESRWNDYQDQKQQQMLNDVKTQA